MKVNEIITSRFIESLESGNIPWRKPWKNSGGAFRNAVTGRAYSGINVLLCAMLGDGETRFLTFKQIKETGGTLKTGSKGVPICFYARTEKTDKATGEVKQSFFLKYYSVFRLADTEGCKVKEEPRGEKNIFSPCQAAENLIARNSCPAEFEGDRACYSAAKHQIKMPKAESFETPNHFYHTFFHEIGHSLHSVTGCKVENAFGSEAYAKEELTAEIFASFCSNSVELETPELVENQIAYVQNWIATLKRNPSMIIQASSKAQKRFDNLTGKEVEKFDA
jgi:antirestriction protein ArdC